MNNTEILNWLNSRYATKMFDKNKHISDEDFTVIKESLRLAPSSYGLQPWKFIIVENPEVKAELREHSWGQSQVTDASKYIVLTYREDIDLDYIDIFLDSVIDANGWTKEDLEGYRNMMKSNLTDRWHTKDIERWAAEQANIALWFVMLTAWNMWIDTCALWWIDAKKYDEILDLEWTWYKTCVAIALGYRSEDDKYASKNKVRFKEEEVFETR